MLEAFSANVQAQFLKLQEQGRKMHKSNMAHVAKLRDGTDGKNGTDGKDGTKGFDGRNGVDGVAGADGKNGTNGVNGTDGSDGQDGAQGIKGIDGMDRITVVPRHIKEGDSMERNEVIVFKGGIFMTTRETEHNPEEDPHAFISLITGVNQLKAEYDLAIRKFVFTSVLSDGTVKQFYLPDMPRMVEDDADCLIDGDFYFDEKGIHIHHKGEWTVHDTQGIRGEVGEQGASGVDGKDGVRGRKGMRGTTGIGIELLYPAEGTIHVAMTDGTIYKDLFATILPNTDVSQAIARWAGIYKFGKNYAAGDMVSSYRSLWLCINANNGNLTEPDWTLMIHAGGGGGVVTGGTGGTVDLTPYQLRSEKGAASGYVPLNPNSKIDAQYLPPSGATPH
ncbi:MAG: collagen-like protein, partial [Deltaproteobacteria bacterium]|nr:collagen-like protein [Deltaproteobacteria bacterium]